MTIDESDYVGKTVEEARKVAVARGLSLRIAIVDDEPTMSTSELREDRVNLKISNGIVEGAFPG